MIAFELTLWFDSVRWVFDFERGYPKYILKIDLALYPLRASYGFVNTLLVLILIKPFHIPILNFKDKCLQHMGIKKKVEKKKWTTIKLKCLRNNTAACTAFIAPSFLSRFT